MLTCLRHTVADGFTNPSLPSRNNDDIQATCTMLHVFQCTWRALTPVHAGIITIADVAPIFIPKGRNLKSNNDNVLLQVWRPLKGPVDESPLTLIDATTLDAEDLIPSALHLPDRTAWINVVKYNPKHR